MKKFFFKSNGGLATLFAGHGLRLEANCQPGGGGSSTLFVRSTTAGNVWHGFAIDKFGYTYYASRVDPPSNDGVDLLPSDADYPMSGKVEFASADGASISVSYLVAFDTSMGDCLFTGNVLQGT